MSDILFLAEKEFFEDPDFGWNEELENCSGSTKQKIKCVIADLTKPFEIPFLDRHRHIVLAVSISQNKRLGGWDGRYTQFIQFLPSCKSVIISF